MNCRMLVLLLALAHVCPLRADEGRMTPELLWRLGRLSGATVSADGSHVAYTVKKYDLADNAGRDSIYVKDLNSGKARALLRDWTRVSDIRYAPSPFGERIYFVGQRGTGDDESAQAWLLNPTDSGVRALTDVEGGISNLKVSPTGKHLAFTVDVKMDAEVTELYEDLPKANARIIDHLMFRHWNAWHDYKYSHLHIAAMNADGTLPAPVDLMKGMRVDCPVPPFAGSEHFAWSPDGRQIAYTAKDVEHWAESTNSDVYVVEIETPGQATNITQGQLGYDNDPVFSPDGKYLAFHSMERPSFESDRNRIMLYDRAAKTIRDLSAGLDQTCHQTQWLPDSQGLLFASEYRGTTQIFRVSLDGAVSQVSKGRFNWTPLAILQDGQRALVSMMSMERPQELAVLSLQEGTHLPVTAINDETFSELELPQIQERWVESTDGKRIHCWVIYPPDFDPAKKWPLLTYCQGGPQSQIGQWFSYRWNFHLMAANGYVIVAPNRRGLPGFGREWNDQISRDWGGQAMQDLLSATDAMLQEPYIDGDRTAAIGASFGGYSVYWLMGHHADRFRCMIAHCGVFNLESMYGSTEELFFVNWDMGGPYWRSAAIQQAYQRFSPHRFVGNWKTPLLVIHGEKDFRVPVTQGIEAFTAAQVQRVPSRFLYFPEEGHWVQKPQNGVLWHRIFFDWLDRYCKSGE